MDMQDQYYDFLRRFGEQSGFNEDFTTLDQATFNALMESFNEQGLGDNAPGEMTTPGILPIGHDMFMDAWNSGSALTPDQQFWNQGYNDLFSGAAAHIFNPQDPTKNPLTHGWGTYEDILAGGYDYNPTAPNTIYAPTVNAALSAGGNVPNAATYNAQGYNAATVDPANAIQAQASQAGRQNLQRYTPDELTNQFMAGDAYANPYLTGLFDEASRRLGQNFGEQVLSRLDDTAVGAGQYGSDRHNIARGIAGREATRSMQDLANQLYGGAYDTGFQALSGLLNTRMGGEYAANVAQLQADTDLALGNARMGTNVSLANALAGNDFLGGNRDAINAARQFGSAAQNAAGQWNTGQINDMGLAGAQLQQDNNQFNAGNINDFSRFNVNNTIDVQKTNANNQLLFNPQVLEGLKHNLGLDLGATDALASPLNFTTGMWNQGMTGAGYENNANWDLLTRYANFLGGIGSGSSVGSTTPPPSNLGADMIGGSMLGSSLWNNWGSSPNLAGSLGGQGTIYPSGTGYDFLMPT